MLVLLFSWIKIGMILQGFGFKLEFFKIKVDSCFIYS